MPNVNPELYPDGVKRTCILCKASFTTFSAKQKYCSIGCANKAGYARTFTKVRQAQEICAKYKMARGCIDCGYKLHPWALQFDHIPGRGKKVRDVSSIAHLGRMWAEIAVVSQFEIRRP